MEKVTLKELCFMQSGGTPSRKKLEYYVGDIPWAKISDLEKTKDGYISYTEEHISIEALKSINNRFFKSGTLLLAMYGSVGKTAITKIDLTTNQAILGINILGKSKLDIKYLRFWFTTIKEQLLDRAVGAALANISLGIVKELEIPLPPLPTQQKIVAILDKADELRQYNRQLIEKYDALTQSLFLEMFGDPVHNSKKWEITQFSEVGKLDRGKSKHRPRNAPELLNGPYPLIQTGDVARSGGYITRFKSTYSEFGLKQSKLWPKETLCITIAANIAQTGILTFEACFPDSVVGFVPNVKTNNIYVQNWMSFLQVMIEEKAPMAAQKNINLAILKQLDFMLPPITLQNQFAERVQAIEAQKQQAQEALEKSEQLFQGLLQQAFKGELN
ncbi:restriction endonuclease subunit S [Flavobacterium weaverense]|uniref:Type I restriction enzyme S subunit n=1 Tax=Flavobacterium weaverense TaxID=271156 RepID=A0A3L9ZRW7_9FLAO|nr:restriction endonuclease subunit S [Flavobacterium weaverense]RMA75037.1 type I restriction enzyme S subunit [Flavobacterium weaverense]